MRYDLYVELVGDTQKDRDTDGDTKKKRNVEDTKKDIDAIVEGKHREIEIRSVFERIRLLTGVVAQDTRDENERDKKESVKEYAISGDRKKGGGYKSLVHANKPEDTPYAQQLIQPALKQLEELHLIPATPDLSLLPPGSWFLQFTFTLAKPWISKDDAPFYVAESVNPVRKDKVFKVPMMSAASWKGLLRWTAMHTRLVLKKDALSPEEFAQERFVQTLLFGDEKGEEQGQTKDFAAYLDALKPEARQEYEHLLRAYYELEPDEPLPHHSGRLMFYPTFFNLIDVEVINPHSRKTRAGTHPIYLECVPQGAKGTFSLLYVPFDIIGQTPESIVEESGKHLRYLAPMIKKLFLTYGFSAKRSSGYGVAKETVHDGFVQIRIEETQTPPSAEPEPKPAENPTPTWLKREFDSFAQLGEIVKILLLKEQGGAG
jgi:CRISPR-associated protein Cmr2